MTKLERFILSVLSLTVGLGLAFVVKTVVWRIPIGPVWIKAFIVGTVAVVAYVLFDRHLFLTAEREIRKLATSEEPVKTPESR